MKLDALLEFLVEQWYEATDLDEAKLIQSINAYAAEQVAAERTSGREGWRYADELEQEHKRLVAQVAEYKQDAERYRYLRRVSTKPYEAWSTVSSPREFDADIDAAIRARGEKT